MTSTEAQQSEPIAHQENPGDISAVRPASASPLEALVGHWQMEASFDAGFFGAGAPAMTSRDARTTFEWLEGKAFLIQRFRTDHPTAPSGIAIIGPAAGGDTFLQHYFDSRGVARVYQMSLDAGVWRLWREEPGFWQRYTGAISDDGARITGAWERSADGREWQHDFYLSYIKAE